MDVNNVYLLYNDIANKRLSGAISPDTFNRYLDLVNLDLFKLKIGIPEDYQIGLPFSRQGLELTFKMSDDVRQFIVPEFDINKNSNGYFPAPSDYAAYDYALAAYVYNDCGNTRVSWNRVEAVTGAERAIRLESDLIPPTYKRPIIAWTNLGFKVNPDGIDQIRLTYLRFPRTPFRNYTINANDEDIYQPNGSVQPEWSDTLLGDFVIRICRYAGIEIREQDFIQYSLQRQQSGN